MDRTFLLLDNYDSFTHNLLHLLQSVRPADQFIVLRNRNPEILNRSWDGVIISPGPMGPGETGLLRELYSKVLIPRETPCFGVCLGMQFLAVEHGGVVVPSGNPVHGRTTSITHSRKGLFQGIPSPFSGARYNSLEVQLPELVDHPVMEPLAEEAETGVVMALRHRSLPHFGVQFHPESFLTPHGKVLLKNFFDLTCKGSIL